MSQVVRDPKGYYAMLGVTPAADAAAVKRAYRTRAKLLHPDRNPSPRASREFHALTEAYHVLADPAARQAYDTGRSPIAASGTGSGAAAADAALTPRTCRVCGRATIDLRHRVLHRVRGRGIRVERRPISGVFCRVHGDRTAVAASLYCWAMGWWALPWGPVATLAALWHNLWGGQLPAAENYQLLTFQARAFLARGNLPIARALAEQARPFAHSAAERQHVAQLLEALADQPRPRGGGGGGGGGRRPWFGSAQVAQLAPLLLIAALALYVAGPARVIGGLLALWPAPVPEQGPIGGATEDAGADALPGPQGPFTGRTRPPGAADPFAGLVPEAAAVVPGRLYAARPARLTVRATASPHAAAVAAVGGGTVLMVTEVSPDGAWSRVLSARGVSGYVPSVALAPAGAAAVEPEG